MIEDYSKSSKERTAFVETGRYIYANPLTRWMTFKGHKACASLRKFDNGLVVDLGCGTGDHFPFIKNSKIIGIDMAEEFLEKTKQKYPEVELRKENIFNLSFNTASLKSIISFGVLEHLTPLDKALKEIKRVMADDGEFIFGIPTEGLLYRAGRNLTTKRHVEKVTGIDYNTLLRKEHINRCKDILVELKNFFILERLKGVPFRFPISSLNIFIVGRCLKKPE